MGMEQNPDQDFLGELYMLCELGNDASGQFFTPYDVCRCMVEISGGSDPAAENAGFFSVSDPACGAGALLIAFANLCRRKNICYHDKVLFVAQDIDLIAGLMCYIQLSFLGCAGYVVIGNTITEPSTAYDRRGLLPAGPQSRIWYTPFFSTDIWYLRRQWAQIELLMKPVCRQTEQAERPLSPATTSTAGSTLRSALTRAGMPQQQRQPGHPRLCGPARTTPSSSATAGPRPHNRQDCLKCPAWSWKWTKGNSCKP